MEASEGSRRHRHPAPATALPVEHSEDEGDTGALAWEPADHLGPAARLAEGALDQVGVPAALPVFFREAQVEGQALEVLDQAGDRSGIGALPLGPEAVDAPAGFADCPLTGWFLDLVEDLPPVRLEGVLVGLGDLGDGVAESMDDTSLAKRSGEDLLDRGDEPRCAVETTRSGEASLRVTRSSRKSAQASVDSELAAARPTRCGLPLVSTPQAHSTGSAGECSWTRKFVPSKNK